MQTFWSELCENARSISARSLEDIHSREEWELVRAARHREYMEMMGLGAAPAKCGLKPEYFGTVKGPGYRIEKVSFQSLPEVRVTGALFIPEGLKGRAPAVLYPCGHAVMGTHWYQPQGDIWARRGYVCLIFNSLEQADSVESGGDHHGIYSGKRNDWISRGYTSAGAELWNSLCALDLLLSRPEVDAARAGVTGISGGGALSWWIAIADERIQASAPFCGTSTIGSYVADRTLNGHCDCMLYHNIFGRDIPDVGALIAPRPLLVCSASEDALFHPESFRDVVRRLKKIYGFYGCEDRVALCEYPGGHAYSSKGHEAVQKWFDKYVAGDERAVCQPEKPRFSEKDLAVYGGAPPAVNRPALLPELISAPGRIATSDTQRELEAARKKAVHELRRTTFRHFPPSPPPLAIEEVGAWVGSKIFDFTAEGQTRLRLWRYDAWEEKQTDIVCAIMGPGDRVDGLSEKVREFHAGPLAVLEPRGTGTLSWHPAQDWMITRAALLTGRTPESVRVWDILRGVQALQEIEGKQARRIFLFGQGPNAVLALHAALQERAIGGVLGEAPAYTHADGPYLLGVLRVLDVPHLAGLLAPLPIGLAKAAGRQFHWASKQYARLGCEERLVLGGAMTSVAEKVFGLKTE